MNKVVAHITSAHPRFDIRIFHKEAISSAKWFKTFLVVADNEGDEEVNHVTIIDVGKFQNRYKRMFFSVIKIYKLVSKKRPDIVHFHDPELLLVAYFWKLKGFKVVYDVHENVHKQILTKIYIPRVFRKILSKSFYLLENLICERVDAIACATPSIGSRFSIFSEKVHILNNFPLVEELVTTKKMVNRQNELAYIGVITEERGIIQLIESIGILRGKFRLNLAGRFDNEDLFEKVTALKGWEYVNFYGEIDRQGVVNLLARSKAGIVNFLPAPNHLDSQPNKLYEYMSAGLPLVCSNFPLWIDLVVQYKCGIAVDPLNSITMAEDIELLLNNDRLCYEYGFNGQKAVKERFNWNIEEVKLKKMYNSLYSEND